jgi:hypothetical protein
MLMTVEMFQKMMLQATANAVKAAQEQKDRIPSPKIQKNLVG